MKEYATLVTEDIASIYAYPVFSRRETVDCGDVFRESAIQRLVRQGWEVIDACHLPRLSTRDEQPRVSFILEREIPTETRCSTD